MKILARGSAPSAPLPAAGVGVPPVDADISHFGEWCSIVAVIEYSDRLGDAAAHPSGKSFGRPLAAS